MVELFRGDEIELPAFDFKSGTRRPSGRKLRLSTGREIVVMEGIHGLNDKLTPRIPTEQKFKVYVSALTQLNLDDHNRISTTDNRLLRRDRPGLAVPGQDRPGHPQDVGLGPARGASATSSPSRTPRTRPSTPPWTTSWGS
ncbi:MAG: hypothetical protein M0C28_22760 [Candidatus Moduliflexus flocculans]|nr:hypothetical protein [Candidatus Moduliflexus flocculans]